MDVRRVGIIGLASSRPRRFVHHLNARRALAGVRVAALVGGPGEGEELRASGRVDAVVEHPSELVGQVDAVIECTRDGARHRAHVEPLLRAGVPAFVDKPLAVSTADAAAMISAARAGRVVLMSCSGFRHAPQLVDVAAGLAIAPPAQRLEISGPADPASEHGGLPYYGIHHVEIALEILRRAGLREGVTGLDVAQDRSGPRAAFTVGGVRVTLAFVAPAAGDVPFTVTTTTAGDRVERTLTLAPDYNERMLERFLGACRRGTWPLPAAALTESVSLVERIVRQL
jgi:hypothetical protein